MTTAVTFDKKTIFITDEKENHQISRVIQKLPSSSTSSSSSSSSLPQTGPTLISIEKSFTTSSSGRCWYDSRLTPPGSKLNGEKEEEAIMDVRGKQLDEKRDGKGGQKRHCSEDIGDENGLDYHAEANGTQNPTTTTTTTTTTAMTNGKRFSTINDITSLTATSAAVDADVGGQEDERKHNDENAHISTYLEDGTTTSTTTTTTNPEGESVKNPANNNNKNKNNTLEMVWQKNCQLEEALSRQNNFIIQILSTNEKLQNLLANQMNLIHEKDHILRSMELSFSNFREGPYQEVCMELELLKIHLAHMEESSLRQMEEEEELLLLSKQKQQQQEKHDALKVSQKSKEDERSRYVPTQQQQQYQQQQYEKKSKVASHREVKQFDKIKKDSDVVVAPQTQRDLPLYSSSSKTKPLLKRQCSSSSSLSEGIVTCIMTVCTILVCAYISLVCDNDDEYDYGHDTNVCD